MGFTRMFDHHIDTSTVCIMRWAELEHAMKDTELVEYYDVTMAIGASDLCVLQSCLMGFQTEISIRVCSDHVLWFGFTDPNHVLEFYY